MSVSMMKKGPLGISDGKRGGFCFFLVLKIPQSRIIFNTKGLHILQVLRRMTYMT